MSDKVIINGKDYSNDIYGLDTFDYKISKTSDGGVETGSTTILKAKGAAFNLIYDTFFKDPCNSLEKKLSIVYKDSICCTEFKFIATQKQVKVCIEDCYAEVVLVEDTFNLEAYNCLKSMINFWKPTDYESHLVKTNNYYLIPTCHDFGFLHKALLVLHKLIISPLISIVKGICDVIEFFDNDACDKLEDDLKDFENEMLGCKRYHTAFNVLDMFQHVSKHCGLVFESKTILEKQPYNCLAWLSAQINEGILYTDCNKQGAQFNEVNAPPFNALQMAEKLKAVFNAEFIIQDGKFYFENRAYLRSTYKFLFDVEKEITYGRIIECNELEYDDDKLCAYGRFQYGTDSIDTSGDKLKSEYNDIVEWNNPPRPNQTKECKFENDFSPASFAQDLEQDDFVNYCRRNAFLFEKSSCDYSNALILTRGTAEKDKLIIIDKNNPVICDKCKFHTAVKIPYPNKKDTYKYNYPMYFDEFATHQELYKEFWQSEDPRKGKSNLLKINKIIYKPNDFCKFVEEINTAKLKSYVTYKGIKYYPSEIVIKRKSCLIELSNLIGEC